MKKRWLGYFVFLSLGILLFLIPHGAALFNPPAEGLSPPISASPLASALPASQPALQYEVHSLPQSMVHVVRIPAQSGFVVSPAVSSGVASLSEFAQEHGAIAVLNAGFFDPVNQETTSYIVLQGEVVADPEQNERLVNNPDVIPYLDQILNRSEFRQYQCGQQRRYDIALHQEPVPVDCQLVTAIGAGPQLLPEDTAIPEGFVSVTDTGEVVRDALGSSQPNARTAVGITATGDILWVMAAQLSDSPTDSGLSLQELADFMGTLGAEVAMNLDGGSSSSLYYNGETFYGRVDAEGNRIARSVKSVLLVHLEGSQR